MFRANHLVLPIIPFIDACQCPKYHRFGEYFLSIYDSAALEGSFPFRRSLSSMTGSAIDGHVRDITMSILILFLAETSQPHSLSAPPMNRIVLLSSRVSVDPRF